MDGYPSSFHHPTICKYRIISHTSKKYRDFFHKNFSIPLFPIHFKIDFIITIFTVQNQ